MTALLLFTAAAIGITLAGADGARAQRLTQTASGKATEAFAQARRPRTRIRVAPYYPYRLYSTTYPVPYKYEYPGPGAVRECTSWLAPENRASGQVIVPRMRCWWER
jgi:hypothetical protein